MPTTDQYLALLPAFNSQRPKLRATIAAYIEGFVQIQAFMETLIQAFDLDTAIGVQLDQVGQWVGRDRNVRVPLPSVYFSFDIDHLGFDEGIWKGPFDPIEGLTSLDDPTYRLLLRAKIAANSWEGTVTDARRALRIMFIEALQLAGVELTTEAGDIITTESGEDILLDPLAFQGFYVEDRFDMSMVFGMAGNLPSPVFLSLFAGGYIPLKPAGVKGYYLFTSINGTPVFGFDVQNGYLSGFDTGSWGINRLDLLQQ